LGFVIRDILDVETPNSLRLKCNFEVRSVFRIRWFNDLVIVNTVPVHLVGFHVAVSLVTRQ